MNLLDYEENFYNDLFKIEKALGYFGHSISYAIIDQKASYKLNRVKIEFTLARDVFIKLRYKELFLTVYMFKVLFDQAIHSVTSKKRYHNKISFIPTVPSYRGILGTYHCIVEPSHILNCIFSYYLEGKDKKVFIDDFKKYTDIKLNEYDKKLENIISIEYKKLIKNKIFYDIGCSMSSRNYYSDQMNNCLSYLSIQSFKKMK